VTSYQDSDRRVWNCQLATADRGRQDRRMGAGGEIGTTARAGSEHRVARAEEIAEGERLLVSVDGLEVGVFRVRGTLHAWENSCVHQGGPVCTGRVLGRTELILDADKTALREERSTEEIHIACPWHGWEFNLETGVCPALPSRKLRRVEVAERDGEVLLKL
jgi:nitrite reductase/ring-hydroxylating ferredoxin subunit